MLYSHFVPLKLTLKPGAVKCTSKLREVEAAEDSQEFKFRLQSMFKTLGVVEHLTLRRNKTSYSEFLFLEN